MLDLERRALETIAAAADQAEDSAVSAEHIRKAAKASPEGMGRALKSLQAQGFVQLDEDVGTVTITSEGREALSGGA